MTMIVLVLGGLLIAGLVGWALTRTVEPAPLAPPVAAAADPVPGFTPGAPTPSMPPPANLPDGVQATPASAQNDRTEVTRIAAEDLRAKLNRGEVTLIDVRDAGSFSAGHIPGAINIPFGSVEAAADSIPKGKPIVTYCT